MFRDRNLFAKFLVMKLPCEAESSNARTKNGSFELLKFFIIAVNNKSLALIDVDGEVSTFCSATFSCNSVLWCSPHFRQPFDLHLLFSLCFDKQLVHNFNMITFSRHSFTERSKNCLRL